MELGIIEKQVASYGPSFSLSNRATRVLWRTVWFFLFRPSPKPLHAWRRLLLLMFGAKIGLRTHVYGDVDIWAPWNLSIGSDACLGPRVICYNIDKITIGDRTVISQGVHLCTGSHDYESPSFQLIAKPIIIDSDVWVCTDAFVAPGVVINQGCVIGARSVVVRSQPKWMVCSGNPCQPIKIRITR